MGWETNGDSGAGERHRPMFRKTTLVTRGELTMGGLGCKGEQLVEMRVRVEAAEPATGGGSRALCLRG